MYIGFRESHVAWSALSKAGTVAAFDNPKFNV